MPFETYSYERRHCIIHHLKFSGELTLDDFQAFKQHFDALLEGERFGALFDIRETTSVAPNLMWEQVRYMGEYSDKAKIKLIASAVILSSSWMSNLLNFLFKFKSPCAPNHVVTDFDEGQEFVDDHAFLARKKLSF